MELDTLEELVKHLPGQHDQRTHGRKRGRGNKGEKTTGQTEWKEEYGNFTATKGDSKAWVKQQHRLLGGKFEVRVWKGGKEYWPMGTGKSEFDNEKSAKTMGERFLSGKWKSEHEWVPHDAYLDALHAGYSPWEQPKKALAYMKKKKLI